MKSATAPRKLQPLELDGLSLTQREAVLSELVARFNSAPPEARENGFEQWLWRELDRLDAARLRAAPGPGSRELSQRVDDWLQSAGDVGGPEQEQDPTRRPGQR
jgi:hypothetical protein